MKRTLLTGATGYVGGRLRRRLEEKGVPLRCLARRPEALRTRVAETTEVVAGDVFEPRNNLDFWPNWLKEQLLKVLHPRYPHEAALPLLIFLLLPYHQETHQSTVLITSQHQWVLVFL